MIFWRMSFFCIWSMIELFISKYLLKGIYFIYLIIDKKFRAQWFVFFIKVNLLSFFYKITMIFCCYIYRFFYHIDIIIRFILNWFCIFNWFKQYTFNIMYITFMYWVKLSKLTYCVWPCRNVIENSINNSQFGCPITW